jgi:transcriptional regulator with XRE-family HTH domain
MTGRGKGRGPDSTDVYVGRRLRARRTAMSLSQSALADRAGVTFQQIQKYERGVNRISASRLQCSQTLQVPVAFFFQGGPDSNVVVGDKKLSPDLILKHLATAEALTLTNAFMRIKNKRLQSSIVALVEKIVEANGAAK